MKRANNSGVINFAVSMTLFTVFALFLMLVLITGASSFKNVSDMAETRFHERTPLLYISQKLRANDRAEAIRIGEVEGIPALMMTERFTDDLTGATGSLTVYIYYYNGHLNELFTFDDDVPQLRLATPLFPAEDAGFEMLTPALIKVTVNGKSIHANLSSEVIRE